jgi:pimeloyl-ACP methyl ester carboxylesterase
MKTSAAAPLSRRQLLAGTMAAVASAGLPAASRAQAQSKRSPVVLVHGAWHGGWCWRRVGDRLTAKGRYVVAPTLSGVGERSHLASDSISLSTHIDDVVNEIRWKDLEGLVLVGHSYGGMVITGVAERIRDRIAAIVYLDAFLPQDGQSLSALLGPSAPSWPEHMVAPIPAASFRVNAKDAVWVDSKMTPHPVRCFTETLRVSGAYLTIAEKLYIRALDFPSTSFDAALDRCRTDRAWRTNEMKCGHDVMIDQPAELATILEGLG